MLKAGIGLSDRDSNNMAMRDCTSCGTQWYLSERRMERSAIPSVIAGQSRARWRQSSTTAKEITVNRVCLRFNGIFILESIEKDTNLTPTGV